MLVKIGIVILMTLSVNANAADKNGVSTVLSMGAKSCGEVVSDYDDNMLVNSVWIGGFASAINLYVYNGKDIAKGTDPKGRNLWIYNYCEQNPLKSLQDATVALLEELMSKK